MRFKSAAGVAMVALAVATTVTGGDAPKAYADSSPVAESFMQIVAHQDDDILFMNPDISREYSDPSVTVFLTGGDATGTGFPDICAYSASRDTGARAAHARLAGVTNPTWTRTPLTLSTGKTVEVDTLDQASQVKLVFFRLHASGDIPAGNVSPDDLFTLGGSNTDSTLGSAASDGNCDATYGNQSYTHADLTASLTDLMSRFQPTVVLAQDPRVGYGYSHTDITDLGDQSDHIGGSRFVGEAALGYHGPGGSGHFLLRNYRDYNIRIDPPNVDPTTADDKEQTFLTYLGPNQSGTATTYQGLHDPVPDPNESTFYAMFPARQYPRWSNGTAWSALDRSGLLNAFAVLDGHVQVWRETSGGASWNGPSAIPGGDVLSPALGVIKDGNGLIHLFGIRLGDNQIVTVAQTAPGAWGDWTVLGNPNPTNPQYVGSPTPVLNQNGLLTVFVSNAGGGVSAVSQLNGGGWTTSWADLQGSWVRDGLAAAQASDGRVDVFAPSVNGILHWRQSAPNSATYVQDTSALGPAPAGPITVGKNADGRLEIFYDQGGTAQAATQYVQSDGTWTTSPSPMDGPVSMEGVSVVTGGDGRNTVVTRNGGGGVSMTSQTAANTGFASTWPDLGNVIVGAPSVTLDGAGRETVLALGRDAALHVSRQTAAGTDKPFGAWQLAGD
ncbi:PIG-L family deacetylase [Kitasatospora cathayae]|uniref:PIG-L family deacetylase n=1 Tax=Kitasatospora cathayae TaxID=3004092 RepID=A0ABY7QFA1_9ACTN|nr:PIG-L family deacetylase [Kitasatospora sp. HUAS 3-15]WBP91385.1 PIG-L family deacetylase [Kitasatospora sp. HUAS 3-15]